ncbi:MAG: OB-fold domain-containing protein [Actinobacteria bacterium]|nr:OB-fold domain-containing protein [Actinomycetota bacterium]
MLVPEVDDESAGFWEATARDVLAIQACEACGALRHPPRPMCPHCNSTDRGWREVSGRGTVWSYVVAHPPLLPTYAALAPYNVIVVALVEDPTIRLVGNLVVEEGGAPDEIDPAGIVIGESVEAVFERRGELHLPQWVRA